MTTETMTKPKIHVDFQYDQDTDSPIENDVFTLLTVDSCGGGQLAELLDTLPVSMKGKTWWIVSCYRHGGEHWFLHGDEPAGTDQWDTTQFAGLLYLPSADPDEVGPDPKKAAEGILEEYNRYCDGDCWYYKITYEVDVEHNGNCPCCNKEGTWFTREFEVEDHGAGHGGIIGSDYAIECLVDDLKYFEEMYRGSTDKYEVRIGSDQQGKAHWDDIQAKIREVGFRFAGDPE